MTETGPYFTTWRPLQHEPFGHWEAIWYPAVQVDRALAAKDEEIAKLQEQVRFGTGRIYFHLNRADRAEKEIADLRKQLEPLDLYRKVLPIVLQKRDAARKELADTLHALHHHDDCNAVKAARAEIANLRDLLEEQRDERDMVYSWYAGSEKELNAARAKVEELKADIETILYECRVMGAEIEAHGSTWVPQPYVNYVSWKAYDSARRALEEGKP